jgi:UrcA family protein
MTRTSLLVAALVLSAATPALAQTSEPTVQVSTTISMAGLDLNTAAGADALLSRIGRAADGLCRGKPADGALGPAIARSFAVCKRTTLARAVATVDSPTVQARYAARTGARAVQLAHR